MVKKQGKAYKPPKIFKRAPRPKKTATEKRLAKRLKQIRKGG